MKIYIQLTAGRGPVECARAVALVAQELRKSASEADLVDYEEHNHAPGCFMSMTFGLDAEETAIGALRREWEGSVLYVATSNPYRPGHKRRNWFVGVNFIEPVQLAEISDSDICYETCRSGGKGGQNVNKVETSVRAVHIPTGIAVRSSDERSQPQNKSRARERLILKLSQQNTAAEADATRRRWANHTTLRRGNPVKTLRGPL